LAISRCYKAENRIRNIWNSRNLDKNSGKMGVSEQKAYYRVLVLWVIGGLGITFIVVLGFMA